MKLLKYRKIIITIGIILALLLTHWGVSAVAYEGESALKMSVTLWYLNDSGRSALRIAADSERFITTNGQDMYERIAAFIPSISTSLRGNWELFEADEQRLIYERSTADGADYISFNIQPYLDRYLIFSIEE